MSQVTQIQLPTTGTISGLAYTQQLNQILEAIGTQNKGGTAPQNPYAGMFWLDDSASPTWVLKQYDAAGTGTWRTLVTIDTQNGTVSAAGNGNWATKNANVLAKTAAYTVADTDDGKLIAVDATTTAITVTLPAASTAGDGFLVAVRKTDSGSNKVTVQANGTETIDGANTYDLLAQYSTIVLQSDGAGWHVLASHSPDSGNGVPTGSVQCYAGSAAPSGWLLCDGSAVSRTAYAALFSAIGTTFGAGDGSTTFNLPDLRGKTPVGVGTGPGLTPRSLGDVGGEETHVLTVNEMPSHSHSYQNNDGSNKLAGSAAGVGQLVSKTTGNTGGGAAHNNMQPFLALNYIIKT